MRTTLLASLFVLLFGLAAQAQTTRGDIPVAELPKEVRAVLDEYLTILRTSKDIDECADRFAAIAGGSLVNEDGITLRQSVKPFGLNKDFNNLKHYANPIRITRVNLSMGSSGYGESAIRGKIYKIWIDKKSKDLGMPAPVSILLPEGHATIKAPKVINVGSY